MSETRKRIRRIIPVLLCIVLGMMGAPTVAMARDEGTMGAGGAGEVGPTSEGEASLDTAAGSSDREDVARTDAARTPVSLPDETFSMVPAPDFGVRSSQDDTQVQWFTTSAGDVAYCLDKGRAFRTGTVYDSWWNPRVGYWVILLDGYPCNTILGGVPLSADEARAATQYALWAFKMDATAGVRLDLGSCYAVTDQGSRVLAAARWLAWKAWSNPYAGIFASADEVPDYVDLSTITGDPNAALSPDGGTLVFGPFSTGSEVATARVTTSVSGMDGWTYCTAEGTPTGEPTTGQDFYIGVPRAGLAPEGSAIMQVVIDRMHLAALVWGEPTQTSQDMGAVYNPHAVRDTSSFQLSWAQDTVYKVDDETDAPLSDATFVLAMRDGGTWTDIGTATTDDQGRVVFGALAPGDYRVTEVRAPRTHADAAESGYAGSQTFSIGPDDTGVEQIFRDRAIAISCEVHMSTIALTSAAFASLPGQAGVDNVGRETYAYHIGYASTSNVRADEFTVDDPLEGVGEGYVRVREIWTPTTTGDTDGKMNVWYRTDRTDAAQVYDTASAMDTNPWNPHNPDGIARMPNTGWRLWARDIDCSARNHLTTEDLHLAEDEHLTAIRFEHGSVEEGFTTNLDATYLVYATQRLDPSPAGGGETVIHGRVAAHIFCNLVLEDEDTDAVQTKVIGTFSLGSRILRDASGSLARTGDASRPLLLGVVACATGACSVGLVVGRRRKKKSDS